MPQNSLKDNGRDLNRGLACLNLQVAPEEEKTKQHNSFPNDFEAETHMSIRKCKANDFSVNF